MNAPTANANAAAAPTQDEEPNRTTQANPGAPTGPTTPIMDAEDAMDDPLVLYTIMIDRDANTRIPTQMRGFEVPVVMAIYGEARVFIVDQEELDNEDFDSGEAYDSLVRKYRNFGDHLRAIYGSQRAFEKAIGVSSGTRAVGNKDKQSMSKVRKPAKKAASKR